MSGAAKRAILFGTVTLGGLAGAVYCLWAKQSDVSSVFALVAGFCSMAFMKAINECWK